MIKQPMEFSRRRRGGGGTTKKKNQKPSTVKNKKDIFQNFKTGKKILKEERG